MRALNTLATEIYKKVGSNFNYLQEKREATKNYILNEITHWTIKSTSMGDLLSFKPVELVDTETSPPFEVRLEHDEFTNFWELKFGNLNAESDEEKYKWDDNDPNRLQKALFLRNVLDKRIIPLLKSGDIQGISFSPYDGDGLGDDRVSYFRNMFSKLNSDNQYSFQNNDGRYSITRIIK